MDDVMFIINLRLGNFRYPIKVKRADEELYRTAADNANDMLSELSLKFSDIKETDRLSLVALQLAYEYEALKKAKG